MSSEPATSVKAFFESYREAFERLDAAAIADLFAYPGHITSDAGEIVLTPIPAKKEWIHQIEQLLATYRTIGFASARIIDLKPTELSPRLVQASVHWALRDGQGRDLYDFETTYMLARINGNFRIATTYRTPRFRSSERTSRRSNRNGPATVRAKRTRDSEASRNGTTRRGRSHSPPVDALQMMSGPKCNTEPRPKKHALRIAARKLVSRPSNVP